MIKEHDFVEIEYTGKIKEENIIFDTTNAEQAKSAGIYNKEAAYKSRVICIGEGHVLKGIDNALLGKEVGKEYTFDISAQEGFGKKRADLLQLIATPKFKKHGIMPVPGLQVNIDNTIGIIKTVTGGRTLVDFNHPCAGKELVYTVKVIKHVTDIKEKVTAVATMLLGEQIIKGIEVKEKNVELTLPVKFPAEIEQKITENIKKVIPEIEKILILCLSEKSKQ